MQMRYKSKDVIRVRVGAGGFNQERNRGGGLAQVLPFSLSWWVVRTWIFLFLYVLMFVVIRHLFSTLLSNYVV